MCVDVCQGLVLCLVADGEGDSRQVRAFPQRGKVRCLAGRWGMRLVQQAPTDVHTGQTWSFADHRDGTP